MTKNRMRFVVCCICMNIFMTGFGMESRAMEITASRNAVKEESVATPRSEEIVWVFTEIDGKLYRRLYNRTTGEYIGDWILCE